MSREAPAAVVADRVAEMRAAFDRVFAAPLAPAAVPHEDLVAIRVGADPFAIRVADVAGLYADKVVRRLPGAIPALAGIAGFRGVLVPVYDLGALLGYASDVAGGAGARRWLVLTPGTRPVALAIERLDGHLRVAKEAIFVSGTPGGFPNPPAMASAGRSPSSPGAIAGAGGGAPTAGAFVREVVQVQGGARAIVHLPSLLAEIERRARANGARQKTEKERA